MLVQCKPSYTYEPFGATDTTGGSSANEFGFTGRESDAAGLHFYRARYYDPRTQRFLSEDPLGFAGGSNAFAYVGNRPTRDVDPLGLKPQPGFTPGGPGSGPGAGGGTGDSAGGGGSGAGGGRPESAGGDPSGGCPPLPAAPPNTSVRDNIMAGQMANAAFSDAGRTLWFRDQVQRGGPMDYHSRYGPQFEVFGNVNYGATGQAAGIAWPTLAAGSMYAHVRRHGWDGFLPDYMWNELTDQHHINQGYKYAANGCR